MKPYDNNSKLISWLLRNKNNVLPITILFFVISLIIAIIFRIDGLGIFSISASIIFFILLIYAKPKDEKSDDGTGGSDTVVEKNATHVLEQILQQNYLPLIIKFFISIVSYLEKNIEKLSNDQIDTITHKVDELNDQLKQGKNHPSRSMPTRKK